MATSQEQEQRPAVVCVFCGSTAGNNPKHLEAARALAVEFHKNNIHLVYGGGSTGLMGEVARTLVSLSGPEAVHGIIPGALVSVSYDKPKEEQQRRTEEESTARKAHERVLPGAKDTFEVFQDSEYGTTTVVPDMHTRKRLMARKVIEGGPGSGFVSLAGGFGTMEEVMEMTTWNQLGIHKVGIVLLNIDGYWDGVMGWIKNAVKEGFIHESNGSILVEAKEVAEVLPKLRDYKVSSGRMGLNWGEE